MKIISFFLQLCSIRFLSIKLYCLVSVCCFGYFASILQIFKIFTGPSESPCPSPPSDVLGLSFTYYSVEFSFLWFLCLLHSCFVPSLQSILKWKGRTMVHRKQSLPHTDLSMVSSILRMLSTLKFAMFFCCSKSVTILYPFRWI